MCFTCPLKLRLCLVVNEHLSHQNDNFELFTSPIMMSHVASRSSKQQLMMNMKPVSDEYETGQQTEGGSAQTNRNLSRHDISNEGQICSQLKCEYGLGVAGAVGSPGLPQARPARVHLRPPARGEVREEERQVEVDHPAVGHDLARHLGHRPQGRGLSGGLDVKGGS